MTDTMEGDPTSGNRTMSLAERQPRIAGHGAGRHEVHAGHQWHASRAASGRSLKIALALIGGYMLAEVVGGLIANSLALLADAGHMLTDTAAIGLALLAMWLARRPASFSRTFGFHRTEILAAFVNALTLWAIAGWVFFEAYVRFTRPAEAQGTVMLIVGSAGLLVNLAAVWFLRRSAGESLNVEGAFLHVLGDLLGSIGVVAASVLILVLGWGLADPIFGVIIALLILVSSGRLLWKALHVLMEGTPAHLDLDRLCQRLEQVEGVTGVHDIHAWSVTTGYENLSAHVTTGLISGRGRNQILRRLREIASKEFGIAHVTIQLEDSPDGCAEHHHIDHLEDPPRQSEGQHAGS